MDIVVTIPKSEYGNDDVETAVYLADTDSYEQFWTLSKTPKSLKTGDRVFFVKHNKIESSMRVKRIIQDGEEACDVTQRVWSGRCQIFMDNLRYESLKMEVKGFQGFRYKWWE